MYLAPVLTRSATSYASVVFFFNDTATTEIYTLSLHDALPISLSGFARSCKSRLRPHSRTRRTMRSEEHTSELQSLRHLVCRLLLEKKNRIAKLVRRFDKNVKHNLEIESRAPN